jgi:hypothetical protein
MKYLGVGCRGAMFGAALIVAAVTSTVPADARQDRCLVLGPLAVSSYIGMLEQVAQKKRDEAARQGQNATNVIVLYEQLGCPQKALISAIECVSGYIVSPRKKQPITAVARQCMDKAGMPTR